jgi:hypothetical protein
MQLQEVGFNPEERIRPCNLGYGEQIATQASGVLDAYRYIFILENFQHCTFNT